MVKDFQLNLPVFVRTRHKTIQWKNNSWTYNEHIPWEELQIPAEAVRLWFTADLIYHNEELEVQSKVGDRLSELSSTQIVKLVTDINLVVKKRTLSTKEFNDKKCRISKLADKQRGLVRSFLRNNDWIEEDFYRIRDSLLDNK